MILRRGAWLILFAPIVIVQMQLDKGLGEFRAQEEVLYLWSGGQVKKMAPGFEGVLADLYWLRTIQYFGGQRTYTADKRFDLLKPLIDITTALDPRMEIAYRYGAIFLSESWPIGAGRPNEGISLLARGAPLVVEGWRLRQQEGYFTFLFLKDPRKASDILLAASKMPGAPYWLEALAGQILISGGEREISRRIWNQIYAESEPGAMRQNAVAHLQHLDALDAVDAMTKRVKAYEDRYGSKPPSLQELTAKGLHQGPPLDPSGIPFDYDPRTGTVRISKRSQSWRPEETIVTSRGEK
jgi:hypothetical protein